MKTSLITNSTKPAFSTNNPCAPARGRQHVLAAAQIQSHCLRALLLAMATLSLASPARACETVIWQENFEAGIPPEWSVSAGTWEVGTPTNVGPSTAHQGIGCAA